MYWSNFQKVSFRFFFSYLTLYILSNQFITTAFIDPLWQKTVPWFSKNVLGRAQEITIFTNGSGDTTYNWVSLIWFIVLAFIATIIWSVLDRKRENYNYLLNILTVLIRYYLIYQMVLYGFAKIFYSQFQPAQLTRLVQPYGDSSPMGLLWTFMGYSKGYNLFTGGGELLGALFLLFRRTQTLGALVTFGVMVNVMMLNYCYDVPVKILSTHIVVMAVFIIALDANRLWNFFIKNQPTPSRYLPDVFDNPQLLKIKNILKWIVVIGWLGYGAYQTIEMTKIWGHQAPKPPLYGLYDVEQFVQNGDTLPPLLTDKERWRKLIVERNDYGIIYPMQGEKMWRTFKTDTVNQLVEFYAGRDTLNIDTLYYTKDTTFLNLKGILLGDSVDIYLKRKKEKDFLLQSRKFNWVSEFPFNR